MYVYRNTVCKYRSTNQHVHVCMRRIRVHSGGVWVRCSQSMLSFKVNTYEIKVNDRQIASKRIATTLVAHTSTNVAASTSLLRHLPVNDLFRLTMKCYYIDEYYILEVGELFT